ncbi:FAD binding monooxygenase [Paecilomyces variotii No. 5]|uniref:FAD binding monooxygenase n=1 Tax=Byssochlamys spectabilis (strain No. 5 / NBRC 109023) TaxID=1356009 RepID=V5FKW7_BYSSN|nr:FAD binding monooxygenase [Paecilomyces variotii No. 5]
MASEKPFDAQVLIIGGGLGGLTLAAICKKTGVSCKVLERSKQVSPAGAGISLAPNALRVLDQLGLYSDILEEGQPLRKIQVHRNTTKWSEIDFQWTEQVFGYPVISIERHHFHHLLYNAAGGSETVLLGADVTDIVEVGDEKQQGVCVKLADGREFTGEVAVGADGIRSVTRRILAQQAGLDSINSIRFTGRVHMSGYTAPIENLGPAELGVANWVLYDNSILTTWPCKDNRQWFIGVKAAELKQADRSVWKGATRDTINDAYGDHFHPFAKSGHFRDIVNRSERVVASDVFEETDFPSMAYGRVALLGDGTCTPPNSRAPHSAYNGGACQAIEDATELGNVLQAYFTNKQTAKDIGAQPPRLEDALAQYCEKREGRAKDLVAFSSNYAKVHMARLPYGMGPLVRKFVYAYMPIWGWRWALEWLYGYQPMVNAVSGLVVFNS